MIFQRIWTSIAKTIPYIFVIFQGGGGPTPCPPLDPPIDFGTYHICVIILNSLHPGYFFIFLSSADFFQNKLFRKLLSGLLSECKPFWIQVISLIWVQTVCKVYQQTTLEELKLVCHGFPIFLSKCVRT